VPLELPDEDLTRDPPAERDAGHDRLHHHERYPARPVTAQGTPRERGNLLIRQGEGAPPRRARPASQLTYSGDCRRLAFAVTSAGEGRAYPRRNRLGGCSDDENRRASPNVPVRRQQWPFS
jgi:hypothetical protein